MQHYLHWNSCEESSRSTQWNQRTTLTEVLAFWDEDLLALAWRAAKNQQRVIMLSTEYSARSVVVPARQSDSEPQTKPIVVHTYNQQMNGVDITNQHAVYYFLRKTVMRWRKFVFWTIETAVVNSYVLYNCTLTPRSPNHLAYRHEIVESLATRSLASAPPRRRIGCPCKCQLPEQSESQWLNQQHNLSDRATQLHDCVVCSDRTTKRCRTIYFCIDTPALCAHPCMFRTIPHPYKLHTVA